MKHQRGNKMKLDQGNKKTEQQRCMIDKEMRKIMKIEFTGNRNDQEDCRNKKGSTEIEVN